MTPRPGRTSRGEGDAAANHDGAKLVTHSTKAKKGDVPPALVGKFRRSVNPKSVYGFKGGVGRSTALSLLAGKITRQVLVVDLDEDIIVEVKSTRGEATAAPLKKAKVKQGVAKRKKPLVDPFKAPMTRAEAKRLSESLRAEDGPRRKLPRRP
ncbi:hypothetical protein [Streptomyces sp. Tu10]|uniref:hypothetical protein n=1 Tax=Streptomyces sp. Tu10 TaxID=2838018 RepID=UPI001BDCCDFC|nr:hypothetical protein [Streptomyces sp. Tu10]MBT1103099.1 hypothetical protein [Streptomyces sp. Tu10]